MYRFNSKYATNFLRSYFKVGNAHTSSAVAETPGALNYRSECSHDYDANVKGQYRSSRKNSFFFRCINSLSEPNIIEVKPCSRLWPYRRFAQQARCAFNQSILVESRTGPERVLFLAFFLFVVKMLLVCLLILGIVRNFG